MTEATITKAQKIYKKYTAVKSSLYSLDNDITAVECSGKLIELSPDVAAQVKALLVKCQKKQIEQLRAEFEELLFPAD